MYYIICLHIHGKFGQFKGKLNMPHVLLAT